MIKIWEGKFDAVLVGSFAYMLLFILHEYLFKFFVGPMYAHPIGTDFTMVISQIVMPVPAITAGFVTAYLITEKGLFYGLIVGVVCGGLSVAIDELMLGYFYGANHWYTIAYAISGIIIPSVLAGGVGELFARNKNDRL